MTPRDFVYWLQGYFEISENTSMTAKEVLIVKNHLNLVFKHSIDTQYPEDKKAELQAVHDGVEFKPRGARQPISSPNKLPPGVEVMC